MDMLVFVFLLLPVAFLHGWLLGKIIGVKHGAAMAYEVLYQRGTPTDVKGIRYIELRGDDYE